MTKIRGDGIVRLMISLLKWGRKNMNSVRREKRRRLTAWLAAAAVLVSLHMIRPADVSAAAKKSVVSRDDGVWLFPLDAAFYDEISDWAGCSNNENGLCLLWRPEPSLRKPETQPD